MSEVSDLVQFIQILRENQICSRAHLYNSTTPFAPTKQGLEAPSYLTSPEAIPQRAQSLLKPPLQSIILADLSTSSSQPQSKTIPCTSTHVLWPAEFLSGCSLTNLSGGKRSWKFTQFFNTVCLCWDLIHHPWIPLLLFVSSFHLKLKLTDIPWTLRTQPQSFIRNKLINQVDQ